MWNNFPIDFVETLYQFSVIYKFVKKTKTREWRIIQQLHLRYTYPVMKIHCMLYLSIKPKTDTSHQQNNQICTADS